MLSLYPDLNADILFAAERGFKEMGKTIRSSQMIAISVSLGLTLKLMLKAHDHNLFGEQ